MIDFVKAIKRPFSNATKMGVGFAMSLPIPLVEYFTNVVANGYVYNCGKTAYEGKYELPEWEKFGRYWVQAFVGGIIAILYSIPSLVLLFIFGMNFITDYIQDSSEVYLSLLSNPLSIVSQYGNEILIPIAASIIISYFIPIAILKYIINNDFGAAFNSDVFKKALTSEYFFAWFIVKSVDLVIVFFMLRIIYPLLQQDLLANPEIFVYVLTLTVFVSFISFITSIFGYTVYGSVLKSLEA